jgi:fucose permease
MSQRLIVASFFASFIVLGITATLLGPTLDNLTRQFNIPLENGGLFITLFSTGVTIALIAFGWLFESGRFQPRFILSLGPLMIALGGGLLVITNSALVAFVAVFVFGLGFGGLLIGPNITVSAMFAGSASGRLNALNAFFGIGAILGPQVVNVAFVLDDYRLAYLFTALAAILIIMIFWQIDIPARQISDTEDDDLTPGTRPGIRVNWLVFAPFAALLFVYVGTEVGFGAWVATHLRLVGGLDEATANVGVSFFWAGLTTGRILAALLSRYLQAVALLALAAGIMLAGSVMMLTISGTAGVWFLASFTVGLGCGPMFPTTVAVVSDNYPAQFAAASGLILGVGNAGAMVTPWLQGQVGGGESGGIIVTAVSAGLLLVIIAWIQRQIRPVSSKS